ncbi:MAG: L,D-transpeptidase [Polyangiaceae bacterium]
MRSRPWLLFAAPWLATVGALGMAALSDQPARSQPLWQSSLPLPDDARSVRILRQGEYLWTRPDRKSPRRGTAMLGAQLPLYGSQRGPGCSGTWLNVGPLAWVCDANVELSRSAPFPEDPHPTPTSNGLPLDYYFAGADGSFGYSRLSLGDVGAPDNQYEPGMSVALVRIERNAVGEAYGLNTKGLWLPMRDLNPARPLGFSTVELEDGKLNAGWVYSPTTSVRSKPNGGDRVTSLDQFESIRFSEVVTKNRKRWFKTERGWVSESDVRAPTPTEPPPEVQPDERWIDVEIDQQVVTAYRGATPLFTALASTGKGTGKSERATPKGAHRIWVKLRTTDMDNLENEYAGRYYAIEEVPWVLFFKKGYGLHGTFWHRRFGRRQSHGCVNLTPRAAERFFHWASPRLPAGWSAVIPTQYDPGTLVRVR